jgi:hypothetical protein
MFCEKVLIKAGVVFFHEIDATVFEHPGDFSQAVSPGGDMMQKSKTEDGIAIR